VVSSVLIHGEEIFGLFPFHRKFIFCAEKLCDLLPRCVSDQIRLDASVAFVLKEVVVVAMSSLCKTSTTIDDIVVREKQRFAVAQVCCFHI
jgi:hypothetical protein